MLATPVTLRRRCSVVDPGFWTGGLGGADAVPFINGADHEEDETKDRCGAEGKDRLGGAARTINGDGSGAALPGACEPNLCLEEAASGSSGSGVGGGLVSGWRGGSRTGGGQAPRKNRTFAGRGSFIGQEVRK